MPELSLLTFPIIIFCSMSGHRVISSADVHFYSSTKYAVTALTEGLRQELREANTHIRATVRVLQTYIYKCTFYLTIIRQVLHSVSWSFPIFDDAFLLQSISPGVVETEFAPRLYRDNADKAAGAYTKFKVKKILFLHPWSILVMITRIRKFWTTEAAHNITFHFSYSLWKQ